jgi:glutathione S-transferase
MKLDDPVLQTYLIAASLMSLKFMLQAWITVYRMITVNGGFLHPEDIKKTPLNPAPSEDQLKPNPYVERSRGMQRNDMENIPIFLVIGFLFTLTHPTLWVAQTLMYGYVASRLLHAYALGTAKTHDLRAVFFTIGSLIVIGMSLYTLIFALRG